MDRSEDLEIQEWPTSSSQASSFVENLVQRVKKIFKDSKPVTRTLACILVVGWVLQLLLGDLFRGQFSLVPARVIPKFWMLVTGGLVELSILQLIVDVICLLLVGNLLEPLWGWKEMLKFLVIVNAISFGALMATYILVYIGGKILTLLYAQIGGFSVSIAGLLVGLKQALPEEDIKIADGVSIRFKNLPLIYVGLAFLVTAIFSDGSYFLMALYGTLSSWFYIRYYQLRPELGVHGDNSESFRLLTLFPEVVHPTIEDLSVKATQIFQKKGSNPSSSSDVEIPLSTAENPEATRRRERGAKALEERLEKLVKTEKENTSIT